MANDDDKPKVTDLTTRRLSDKSDGAMNLADALCKTLAAHAPYTSPEDQLLGIELCARATVEAMRAGFGESELNSIIVEVSHRSQQYTLEWDNRHKGKVPAVEAPHFGRERAEVVPLRPRASEEGDDETDR